MISELKKQTNIELKRQIGLLQIQHSDKNNSIEELLIQDFEVKYG